MADPFPDKTSLSSGTAPIGAYVLDDHASDTVDLPVPVRAIRVGADGDFTVTHAASDVHEVINGNEITYTAVAGEVIRGPIVRLHATGLTATDLVGYV
ncbi:spike base protein, RCAP_Rcc01079 family [Rhodoligotrophos defluvii]|uniref:spike base protein, RCAP_Rcc01079 family n=1 Tax=Rhodoligotrophos defluvii TaxID=2561934 RepID=UPI0010C978F0|nr:hypothetical protein [Rhodoligotrophos defluvii]